MTAGETLHRVPWAAGIAAACLFVLATVLAVGLPSPGTPLGERAELEASIVEAPLAFEPNAGRTDGDVEFLAHSVAGGSLYLTSRGAVVTLPQGKNDSRALRLAFPRADPRGLEELPGKTNSFIGDNPNRWRSGIPTYGRVRYQEIYPGIDLDFYGNQSELEYDFRLAPNADPSRIAVEMRGADSLHLARNGDLVIEVGEATVRQRAPVAYQEIAGERRRVPSAYELDGSRVAFRLGEYDRTRPLVIDPLVLGYSTYLGGAAPDFGQGIAVDDEGAAYVVGATDSGVPGTPFPTQDQLFPDQAFVDAFVTKFNPDSGGAATLAYSTYLGASQADRGFGIAVDDEGAAYVTGVTDSINFPTERPSQPDNAGELDVFVTKLNPDTGGAVSLAYSTYLGGTGSDSGNGVAIAVDSAGAAYVSGGTFSTDFPQQDAIAGQMADADGNAFVAKLTLPPMGNLALEYSTYLGGGALDLARENSIAVDSEGAAYVNGNTDSTDFPEVDPIAGETNDGQSDAFVAKLNPDPGGAAPATLAYSTYLSGSEGDFGRGVTTDAAGAAYLTGFTNSPNFPTQDAFQGDHQGGVSDAYVAKLNPDPGGATPVTLAYSTYLGGSGSDTGSGIAVDSAGAAHATGSTSSSNFPTLDQFQGAQGGTDVFATKLNPDLGGAVPVTLAYSTYLGGSGSDPVTGFTGEFGADIAVDSAGAAYVTGSTFSPDFPTQDPFQGDQGDRDAFVARLLLVPPDAGGGGGGGPDAGGGGGGGPDAGGGAGPSNDFTFGKVKKNKNKGTAKLIVNVPGPGNLELAKSRKVKAAEKRAAAEGSVRLKVKPKGKAKEKLADGGKAKVEAEVTYTPDGGDANTRSRKVKLAKK